LTTLYLSKFFYQKKHYNRGDIQNKDLRGEKEECEDSGKDNWNIDIEDEEESDDMRMQKVMMKNKAPEIETGFDPVWYSILWDYTKNIFFNV
jgi:hypothetical protein